MTLRIVLLAATLLILAAFFVDLIGKRKDRPIYDVGSDIQNVIIHLDSHPYVDPDGRFTVATPDGWRVTKPPESSPYQVVFFSPTGADLSIMATPVDYNSTRDLMKVIEENEKRAGIATQQDAFYFRDVSAIKRHANLKYSRVLSIDFVKDGIAHHIIFCAPQEYFEQYEPLFMELLDTYQPGTAKSTPSA